MPVYKKHIDAIEAGTVDKGNIIGLRKAFNANDRRARGYSVGSTASNLTFEQCDDLLAAIYKHKPRAIGDLHHGGFKVLRNPRYAKRLAPFADSIAALDHFRLVDFESLGAGYVPVYAAWSKIPLKGDALDGGTYEAFTFRNVPWQAGGDGPEILS